jgi:hypothetical protein
LWVNFWVFLTGIAIFGRSPILSVFYLFLIFISFRLALKFSNIQELPRKFGIKIEISRNNEVLKFLFLDPFKKVYKIFSSFSTPSKKCTKFSFFLDPFKKVYTIFPTFSTPSKKCTQFFLLSQPLQKSVHNFFFFLDPIKKVYTIFLLSQPLQKSVHNLSFFLDPFNKKCTRIFQHSPSQKNLKM